MFARIRKWFKNNRKALVITATVVAITGTVVVLLIKGKKVEMPMDEFVECIMPDSITDRDIIKQNALDEMAGNVKEIQRGEFIRKLPEGWSASPKKIEEARARNITLKPGETFVNGCTVTIRSAA